MTFSADIANDGVSFEVEADGETYRGTLTIEALQNHFNFSSNEVTLAERFCSQHPDEVEEEIRKALRRHPPWGHENILILPHHMR